MDLIGVFSLGVVCDAERGQPFGYRGSKPNANQKSCDARTDCTKGNVLKDVKNNRIRLERVQEMIKQIRVSLCNWLDVKFSAHNFCNFFKFCRS